MSNSPLVVHTNLSPNCTKPRNAQIDTVTIHCMVGNLSIESCGAWFAQPSTQASSNYGVGADGRRALYVEEVNRSWCTSSSANDNRAVTIEVASDAIHPYAVTGKALEATIELVADICKRNNIKQLLWKADKSLIGQVDKQNMTVHRWFAAKACPGDYLYERHGMIADEVNKLLGMAAIDTSKLTKIAGKSVATAIQMAQYLKSRNPDVSELVISMAPLYLTEGYAEGIRGDVAFAQSCLETGNFTFAGSAVTLGQNNFCGMGVTQNGMAGNTFESPQIGIRAQVQHLKAYANKDPLDNPVVDPRFSYVARGSAEYVEWLGQKENPGGFGWATGEKYGEKILAILAAILQTEVPIELSETEKAKKWAVENKLFQGDQKGDLMWKNPMTREQVAIVLYRFRSLLAAQLRDIMK